MSGEPVTLADLPARKRIPLFPILCLVAAGLFKGFQYLFVALVPDAVEFPLQRTLVAIFYIVLGLFYVLIPKRRKLWSGMLLISVYVVPAWFLLGPVHANALSIVYAFAYLTVFIGILYLIVAPRHILWFGGSQMILWLVLLAGTEGSSSDIRYYLFTALMVLIVVLTYLVRSSEKNLRARLAAERSYFRALYSESPDAQLILDGQTIQDHNRALSHFIPVDGEYRGRTLVGVLSAVTIKESSTDLIALRECPYGASAQQFSCELGFKSPSGDVRWGQLIIKKLDQSPDRFLVTIRDTTEKHLALQRAETAARERARFLSTMSHEIRTPLSAIIGLVRLLREEAQSVDDRNAYLETLSEASNMLMELINSVLDLSKLRSGAAQFSIQPVEIHELADNLVKTFSMIASEQGDDISTEIEAPEQRVVMVDRVRLMQVLVNLLSNALKVTRNGFVVLRVTEVATENDLVTLRFEVADSGPGIAESDLSSIFEEYYHTSVAGEGGTGLGLPLVREILNKFGSEITVESEVGKGSVFRFELSLPLGTLTSEGSLPDTEHLPDRIVIVEDDTINRMILRKTIERWGVVVEEYVSAEDALESDHILVADVFVLDLQLPGVSGVELSRRIRTARVDHQPRILLLSADVDEQVLAGAMAAGVDECLAKPFDPDDLRRAIVGA